MFDVITIGSATQDIFIESGQEKIFEFREPNSKKAFLGFEYGAKIEAEEVAFDIGGGAVNAAVNFANLGFKTATIIKMGYDLNAKAVLGRLNEKNIDESLILRSKAYKTGFSVILTSFEGDRTVLTHRGANNHIKIDNIPWDAIKNSKWLYIAPLSGDSNKVLDSIADFAEENNVSMAINPGSAQIKRGIRDLDRVISTAEVLIMNKSEASHVTGIPEGYMDDSEKTDNTSEFDPWNVNVHQMLCELKTHKPKVVVITDGAQGVIAFDGKEFYHAPSFPAKVTSTLGAGDAFASTFVAGLEKFNWDIEKSLIYASVNSAAVVQSFGAQTGLKTFDEISRICESNKSFKITRKTPESEKLTK
jgi:ribokinase